MGKRKRSEDEVNGFDQLESRRRRVDKLLQHGTAKISQHLEAAKKTDTSDAAAIKVPNAKGAKLWKLILTELGHRHSQLCHRKGAKVPQEDPDPSRTSRLHQDICEGAKGWHHPRCHL